jgi:hypothetical protein
MHGAKINGGEMRGSWGFLGMSEEEVAFYQRFVARHGGALVAMGKAQKSYRRDFSPGTFHGSGESFVFFDFAQPGRLCTRLRSVGAQSGRSHFSISRWASPSHHRNKAHLHLHLKSERLWRGYRVGAGSLDRGSYAGPDCTEYSLPARAGP